MLLKNLNKVTIVGVDITNGGRHIVLLRNVRATELQTENTDVLSLSFVTSERHSTKRHDTG